MNTLSSPLKGPSKLSKFFTHRTDKGKRTCTSFRNYCQGLSTSTWKKVAQESRIKGPLNWLTDLLNEEKENVQCMLVHFFARRAAWLKFTADRSTPKTPATQWSWDNKGCVIKGQTVNSPNKRSRGYAVKVVRFEYSIRDMQSSFRTAGRTEIEITEGFDPINLIYANWFPPFPAKALKRRPDTKGLGTRLSFFKK